MKLPENFEEALIAAKKTGLPIEKICQTFKIKKELVIRIHPLAEARAAYYNAPSGSEERKEAWKRWKELSAKEIEKISTVTGAQEAFDNAPSGSEEQKEIFKKWKSLCSTAADYQAIYYNVQNESEEKKEILKKIILLS